jgi:hypothetical protein
VAASERAAGRLISFAASARVLQLRTADGRDLQVSLAPNAVVRYSSGGVGSPTDLRAGQEIVVVSRRGSQGALVADEVIIGGGR